MPSSQRKGQAPDRGRRGGRRQGIKSLEAGFRLLRVLAESSGAMNLRDLARQAGMSPSKAHRYLVSLIESAAVDQDRATSRYDLGEFCVKLGLAALNRRSAIRTIIDGARGLNLDIDRTVLVSVWGERGPTVIAWYDASEVIFCNIDLGTVFPLLRTATGRVFLAHLPRATTAPLVRAEMAGIARRMPGAPIRGERDVERLIATVRRQGYGMTRGEFLPGLSAAAAPVFDHQSRLVATIAVLGIEGTLDRGGPHSAVEALRRTAELLSHRLGLAPTASGGAAEPRPRDERAARRSTMRNRLNNP